ncbi:hypothetical protein LZ554_004911 [Drepanopeziza brunnea f. sp. 'monogermtubi']|nr:hypothetical protein LZ554_004911 [Drepanopeziza brunnea f. sp. 'monogermtubi']
MDKRPPTWSMETPSLSKDKPKGVDVEGSKVRMMVRRLFKTSPRPAEKPSSKSIPNAQKGEKDGKPIGTAVLSFDKRPAKNLKPSAPIPRKYTSQPPKPSIESQHLAGPVTVSPPASDLPTHTQKDIFYKGKGKPLASSRDSKFSSISSLPSAFSVNPPSPTLSSVTTTSTSTSPATAYTTLNPHEFAHLNSLLRRCARRLHQQDLLANNLANNLLHIFISKEAQLHAQKHLRRSEQQHMLQTLFRVRDHCGRLFLRKAAFSQHAFSVLERLKKVLMESERDAKAQIPDACTSWQASEGLRFVVCREAVGDFVKEMARDMQFQKGLDGDIRNSILDCAREGRWVAGGGVGDKIMMGRFVGFIEARGRNLEECYDLLEVVLKRVEEAVMREKKSDLMWVEA